MKNQDYKNYRATRPLNRDRIASVLLGLALVVMLCVKLPEVSAEQPSQAMTECDGLPTMEMGMPIAIEDWVRT
jgi:hypothetical protein